MVQLLSITGSPLTKKQGEMVTAGWWAANNKSVPADAFFVVRIAGGAWLGTALLRLQPGASSPLRAIFQLTMAPGTYPVVFELFDQDPVSLARTPVAQDSGSLIVLPIERWSYAPEPQLEFVRSRSTNRTVIAASWRATNHDTASHVLALSISQLGGTGGAANRIGFGPGESWELSAFWEPLPWNMPVAGDSLVISLFDEGLGEIARRLWVLPEPTLAP